MRATRSVIKTILNYLFFLSLPFIENILESIRKYEKELSSRYYYKPIERSTGNKFIFEGDLVRFQTWSSHVHSHTYDVRRRERSFLFYVMSCFSRPS